MNASSKCVSSVFKNESRLKEIEADFISKQAGLMSASEQGYQEALRNIQELLKEFIQRIQTILQTFDSSISNMTSKI